MNKDLLRMDNLSKEEILDILNLADQLNMKENMVSTILYLKVNH